MKNLFMALLVVILFTACKENETKTEEPQGPSQMEQVVEIHDELMPKMSVIGELISKIEANIDTLNIDSVKVKSVVELKAANESMMKWMMDFGSAFESDEIMNGVELTEDKKQTLNEFEQSANELKVQMETAIKNAEVVLNQ